MKKTFLTISITAIITGLLLFSYSLYEPYTLKITHYELPSSELKNLKIAFAADFHLAPKETKRLNKIISTINNEQPDIIILGGDYMKGHTQTATMPIEQIAQNLSHLYAPLGIFAVLGNHDNWYNKTEIIAALEKHNITVLDNKNYRLKNLTLVGISDLSSDKPDFVKAFHNTTAPAILITHSPDTFPESPKTLLTLAAHTHGGQINIPYIGSPVVPSKYGQRYHKGLIQENDKTMIVTTGLGTSILPIRFNCPPEIVIITFQ
ncbi:MAG: metallophosphoesterase [Acetobacter sp.]|nr:metallophosphoesterase [Acetobacter sp.]